VGALVVLRVIDIKTECILSEARLNQSQLPFQGVYSCCSVLSQRNAMRYAHKYASSYFSLACFCADGSCTVTVALLPPVWEEDDLIRNGGTLLDSDVTRQVCEGEEEEEDLTTALQGAKWVAEPRGSLIVKVAMKVWARFHLTTPPFRSIIAATKRTECWRDWVILAVSYPCASTRATCCCSGAYTLVEWGPRFNLLSPATASLPTPLV
jgi:hypothetical protein